MTRKTVTWDDFSEGDDLPKIWDPGYGRIVYDELPTISLKRFVKRSNAITTEDIASISFGSGSVMRITRLSVFSTLGDHFTVRDQSGTIHELYPGSSIEYFLGGAPKEPIFIARSVFKISHVGSLSAGTVLAGFEGFGHNDEVGFAHRTRRKV